MHQAATFTPLTTQGFPEMQMQTLSQLNPHVPAPPQPNSALSPQRALGNATTSPNQRRVLHNFFGMMINDLT